jgi:transposase InsO family protein
VLHALRLSRDAYGHLTDAQFAQLQDLLFEFADIFAVSDVSLGCVPPDKGIYHKIPTGDAAPVTQRPYKLSHHESCWLQGELERLLAIGVIRPSQSAWMSPVVLVPKPNGALRLCVDMRMLNKCTVPDPYPLPHIEEMHAAMGGCQLWSKMDYVTGFWQVLVHPDDCAKTGFTTPHGNFEFVRMAMGMMSAPATFQRLMDTMLAGVPHARTYVDDTFAYTVHFDAHIHTLRQIFLRTRDYALKMNPLKCAFVVPEVVCLGHLVSARGIQPIMDKVAAIVELPPPTNAKGMRRFLGMMEHYRKYIPGYARLAAPLQVMTRKSVCFVWTDEAAAAFQSLKDALCSAPVLALPDWQQPFVLTTDWSRAAVGAVLCQVQSGTQEEHPIAFASRALTVAERNYAATEGECLAVKWAVDKFRYYLHGRRFLLRTDHKALEWLATARFANSKLERWAMHLQAYDFEVEYIQGSTNTVADYLSRPTEAVVQCADGTRESLPCGALVFLGAAWPTHATKQSDFDSVACDICGDPGGFDNMAICSGCERCIHLRCVMPPMSTVPSGDWLCPGCDPVFSNSAELCDAHTVLRYAAGDPYTDDLLVAYVRSGGSDSLLSALPSRMARVLCHRAASLRPHPRMPGWFLVMRYGPARVPQWLTCPPLSYRWDIIRCMHDTLGHAGTRHLVACMRQHFHWRGLVADVRLFVAQCDACQRRKLVMAEPPPLNEPAIRGPFEHVHIDLCGPFDTPVKDDHGHLSMPKKPVKAYVVLMIDYFTKAAEFAVIYDRAAASVARAFHYSWLCRYFVPTYVTSDNGSEFQTEFVHLLARLGILHIHTSACHPAANGVVERLVRSFKSMLTRHVNSHPVHWLQSMPVVRQQYWNRLHSALGMCPQEMVFGRKPVPVVPLAKQMLVAATHFDVAVVPDDFECPDPHVHASKLRQQLAEFDASVWQSIRSQFAKNAAAWPLRGGTPRLPPVQLKPGDLVLEIVSGPVPALGEAVKGPFRVVQVRDNGVVVLTTGSTGFRDAVCFKRHVSNLARYLDKSCVRSALALQ